MSSLGRGFIILGAVTLGAACTSRATQVENRVETIRQEQTPEKLLARGRAFASIGDYTRAEQYLAAAIKAGADVTVALPVLLRVCVAEQSYRAAIAYAEPHLHRQPGDSRLRFVVGSLYATIGETKLAREHLLQVAKERPSFAEVHFAMGMLTLEDNGDRVGADTHFREYLRLEPGGSHAAEARGYLLRAVR